MYVSNWGGDHPAKDDPRHKTSGTPVKTDPRTSVANHGSVSVVTKDGNEWKQTKTIAVGGHPSGMVASTDGKFVYVANANSDTVCVIDTATDAVVETIDCKPEAKLPFGTGSNAVALESRRPDALRRQRHRQLRRGRHAGVAGRRPDRPRRCRRPSRVVGHDPDRLVSRRGALSADGKQLFVANVKGHGSLQPRKVDPKAKKTATGDGDDPAAPQKQGKNSHDHLGSVSLIDAARRRRR